MSALRADSWQFYRAYFNFPTPIQNPEPTPTVKKLLLFTASMAALCYAGAQQIVTEYTTVASTTNPTITAGTVHPNVTAAPLSAGSGITANAGSTWNWRGFNTTSYAAAVAAGDFWTWGFEVTGPTSFNLTTMDIRVDRSGTGPREFEIQASVNTGTPVSLLTYDFGSGDVGVNFTNVNLSALGLLETGDVVTFVLGAFNASSVNGTFDLETITFPGGTDSLVIRSDLPPPPPPVVDVIFIHEVQGSTNLADGTVVGGASSVDRSPLVGNTVAVQGIVTITFQEVGGLGGFYVQEEEADYDLDPFSSEGIFVASSTVVTPGDLVTVTGTVAEVEGETRITASSVVIEESGLPLPAPIPVNLETTGYLTNPNGSFVVNLEAYEGMLVEVTSEMTVVELFQLGRFGTIRVTAGGRPYQFTQLNQPDVAGNIAYLQEVAARSLVLDDGLETQNPSTIFIPGLTPDEILDGGDVFRMGSVYTSLIGVVSFSIDQASSTETPEYRLHLPVGTLREDNPRPVGPDDVGGRLKVAAYNVLNFFTTLDTFPGNEQVAPSNQEPRGADTNPRSARAGVGPLDEYNRQLAKLTEAFRIMDADIVGLIEIENDFLSGAGSTRPVNTAAQSPRLTAIEELVAAINAALPSRNYTWVNPGSEFVGDDAIAVGFIFDTNTVTAVGSPAILATPAFLDPTNFGSNRNRAAVAQTFQENATGERFTACVNHLKSKGASSLSAGTGTNQDSGNGAGFWNDTRTLSAQALVQWLATDPTGSGDADFLILGDLNAYAQETPIQAIRAGADGILGTADDYFDLAQRFLGDTAYGFVFDGLVGTLDYALASRSLNTQVTGATEWHINADEPTIFDYNLEFGRDPALFTPDEFRSSDHDPVIIGLNLRSAVTGTPGRDVLAGTPFSDVIIPGGGNDVVTTGTGADVIDLTINMTNNRRDTLLITDFDVNQDILFGLSSSDVARATVSGNRTTLTLKNRDIIQLIGVTNPAAIQYQQGSVDIELL